MNGFFLRLLFLGLVGLGVPFQCRLFLLVQALIFGVLVGFWGAIFRALRLLPGGLARFLPGGIGANHCQLRHIGWDKCCHGLSSRPRETSSVWFLDELLVLFGYCAGSGADLLAGVLPPRYSSDNFACKVPTWRLPVVGSVTSFLASGELNRGGPSALSAALGGACVRLARGSGGGVKRVRLYRKTPAHLARQGISGVQVRPRVWKRLRDPLGSDSGLPGAKFFFGCIRRLEVMFLVWPGRELAEAGALHEPTSPGSCMRGSN